MTFTREEKAKMIIAISKAKDLAELCKVAEEVTAMINAYEGRDRERAVQIVGGALARAFAHVR